MWHSHRETGAINPCYTDIEKGICTPSSDAVGFVINYLPVPGPFVFTYNEGEAGDRLGQPCPITYL